MGSTEKQNPQHKKEREKEGGHPNVARKKKGGKLSSMGRSRMKISLVAA